ncbi:YfhE family protein [Radiobacillus kanasensis]|uniref:YfhE family protein n=1 Tax=Radiobacillus kanasensis TaxID=2844358 RepID=UPI001E3210B8|nr:YfhE family protein [Radiobacillus kanasensis]UFT99790.1 YfhE family protein [Radiobacillus kanasensis]
MAQKSQYQPTRTEGASLSDTQEVLYTKEFKKADIAGGYRRSQVKEARRQNPNL